MGATAVMGDNEVLIAALGIVASVAAALIWNLKFLYTKNDQTLNRLADSIYKSANASEAQTRFMNERDTRDKEFQEHVIASFKELSSSVGVLDEKADRNYMAVQDMTVNNMTVKHETIETIKTSKR